MTVLSRDISGDDSSDKIGESRGAKKPRLVWTSELHARFMNAVNHLVTLLHCVMAKSEYAQLLSVHEQNWRRMPIARILHACFMNAVNHNVTVLLCVSQI